MGQRAEQEIALNDPLDLLLSDAIDLVEIADTGAVSVDVERSGRLLYPGSFNPLHEGHCKLAAAAKRCAERPSSYPGDLRAERR